MAVELVDTRLEKADASGYDFLFAERDGVVIGYACFGLIACTLGSYDLYWIAVDPAMQGCGIGRQLLTEVEQRIARADGRHLYIETSGRSQYAPTRIFYQRCGFELAAVLPDFYNCNDDKVICAEGACMTVRPSVIYASPHGRQIRIASPTVFCSRIRPRRARKNVDKARRSGQCGDPSSTAANNVQRPSPESDTRPANRPNSGSSGQRVAVRSSSQEESRCRAATLRLWLGKIQSY